MSERQDFRELAQEYLSRLPVLTPGVSLRVPDHGMCHSLPDGWTFVEVVLALPPGAEEKIKADGARCCEGGGGICPSHLMHVPHTVSGAVLR